MHAIRAALERAGRRAEEVEAFAHGMTVATNALLEGRGARTALVATAGFEDVVELGRQARADLYRLCRVHPAPLVPGHCVFSNFFFGGWASEIAVIPGRNGSEMPFGRTISRRFSAMEAWVARED